MRAKFPSTHVIKVPHKQANPSRLTSKQLGCEYFAENTFDAMCPAKEPDSRIIQRREFMLSGVGHVLASMALETFRLPGPY